MNFALVMMSSAWIAGGDPTACVDCAVPVPSICDPCTVVGGPGLLTRLKTKLPGGDCLGCLPGSSLFAKLKAKLQMPEPVAYPCSLPAGMPVPCSQTASSTIVGVPFIGSCHLPPVPAAVPVAPAPTPKEMPKPDVSNPSIPKAMPKPTAEPAKEGKVEAVSPLSAPKTVQAGGVPAVPF